ncbi:MAG: xanthine dehydrogenase family protein subunit M [Candidatus Rokubacteria bacterium]|nr:xanthine dehydrogenase family protein subunit M [Candidatus Rokubacteria bacterium]
MKPPPFEYHAPPSLEEALTLLREHGDEAKALAGGQSLVPLLNFRLARPRHLIDLNRIPSLDYIREDDGALAVGAMTRQRAVERSPLVRERCPLLAEAMPLVGHFQIRNRGTVGGSLAHADPAAELPAVVTALRGALVARRPGGQRVIPAERFFVAYLTTALEPDELLVEARFPAPPPRSGSAFLEVSRRHGDFALVGVAAVVTLDEGGVLTHAALALTGVGPTPVLAEEAARVLVGDRPTPQAFEAAARKVSEGLRPDADLHASAEYRRHVAGVLARRALARAVEQVGGGAR